LVSAGAASAGTVGGGGTGAAISVCAGAASGAACSGAFFEHVKPVAKDKANKDTTNNLFILNPFF